MIVDPSHLLKNINSFRVEDSLEVKKLIVWIAAEFCAPSVHTCSPGSHHHAGNHACQSAPCCVHPVPRDSAELTTFMLFLLVLSW